MKFIIATCALLFVTFYSCQKGITDPLPLAKKDSTPIPITGDSTLIARYIEIDTSVAAPLDTISKRTFTYDNLKRLSVATAAYYTNGILLPYDATVTTFSYNGNDTLPYREVETGVGFGTGLPYTDTRYYTFVAGKLVYDSTKTMTNVYTNKYTYFPTKIIDSTSNGTIPANTVKGLQIVHFVKTNGLIMEQKDTIVHFYNGPGIPNTSTNYTVYAYDNNPNPLYKFKSLFPFYGVNDYPTIFSTEKYNLTEVNTNQIAPSAVSNFHYKYRYQYNANGYPKIVWITDQNNPALHAKGFYYYTK